MDHLRKGLIRKAEKRIKKLADQIKDYRNFWKKSVFGLWKSTLADVLSVAWAAPTSPPLPTTIVLAEIYGWSHWAGEIETGPIISWRYASSSVTKETMEKYNFGEFGVTDEEL